MHHQFFSFKKPCSKNFYMFLSLQKLQNSQAIFSMDHSIHFLNDIDVCWCESSSKFGIIFVLPNLKHWYHKTLHMVQTTLPKVLLQHWKFLLLFLFKSKTELTTSPLLFYHSTWNNNNQCTTYTLSLWVQSRGASYQRLLKWYLIPPCWTLSNIRYVSRVKWSNPGKGVAHRCSSYRLWLPTLLTIRSILANMV